jgi:hypothetical protein
MKPEVQELIKQLDQSLEGLIKVYRHLLTVVRKERELLVGAKLDELAENNRVKEMTLLKVRELEETRIKVAKELARQEGLDAERTRLLDFARHFDSSPVGERFRKLHSVLDLLIKRVREHNQYNEVLVTSALDTMTGAIGHLRDNLGGGKTYKKSGAVKSGTAESGQLVSKEA